MANYISQHTGAQIDNGVAKANSAVQPSDLTTALVNKQDNLVSGTNIKSLNSTTLLGTGNIDINKTTLGLNNVDNTADLAKPISTDTQTALNGKAASAHTHATTDVSGLDTALSGKAASVHNHVTSDVTGLDTALNAKVDKEAGKGLSSSDYTSTEKTKLADIADNANNYTHPATHPASVIEQDASNRFVTDAEKTAWNAKQPAGTYATGSGSAEGVNTGDQTDITGNAGTATALSDGADRIKLDGIATGANNYTHPVTHPASVITQDSSNRFVTDAEKATWNSNVTEHEAAVDPHPQYKVTPTLDAPLSFTYTGTLAAAPTAYQTAPMLPAPSGKEWVGWVSMAQIGTGVSGITFPNLEGVGGAFNPSNMDALTSLSLPALTTTGSSFNPSYMAALTSLSVPVLTTVGTTFNPNNMAALTSLSLPALTIVGTFFNPNNMAALTSLSLPALTTVGTTFNPNNMAALTSLSLPVLTTVGAAFNPNGMAALTSLSLLAIERIGTSLASGDAINISTAVGALTSFILPATLKQVGGTGGNVTITSAALNQTSVDSILVRLAALDGTNGTTAFNNRTVTITGTSAAPSATGLAAKATLVARGCNVTHK